MNMRLTILNNVYPPAEDSWQTAETLSWVISHYMRINSCIPRIIDVGSGTGILAIIATARALEGNISPWVIAIDHDYNASMNTRINIINNGLHSYADVVSTTVLNAIKHGIRINIIVSNPPYLPGDWKEDWRIFGGPDGN
jgi:release factor glutamine methyltransferase